MLDTQIVFNGGLGNQIFQYLASKYIYKKSKDLNISYLLAESIFDLKYRDFELNKLLVKPIKTNHENLNYFEKITFKVLEKLFFLNKEDKEIIKYNLNLFNESYEEQIFPSNFVDPLLKLTVI